MSFSAIEPTIYFGADGKGLQSYRIATSEVKNYTSSGATGTGNVYAVTYDSNHDKLYWSGYSGGEHKIWRGNRDGSDVEVVLSKSKCEWLTLLSFSHHVMLCRMTNGLALNTAEAVKLLKSLVTH